MPGQGPSHTPQTEDQQLFPSVLPPLPSHKKWEAEQVVLYLTDSDPDLIPLHGWERAYTDKLGRSQVKATGPKAYTILGAPHPRRPDWLVEAIRRQVHPYPDFPRANLALDAAAKHPPVEDLFTATPEDSVDHHLLNKLASFLSAEIIVIPNPINPHLETHYVSPQRYLDERPPFPRPLILSLAHLHKTSLLRELLQATSNLPRLMIFTETQRRILRLDLDSYNLCASAPPSSIVPVSRNGTGTESAGSSPQRTPSPPPYTWPWRISHDGIRL